MSVWRLTVSAHFRSIANVFPAQQNDASNDLKHAGNDTPRCVLSGGINRDGCEECEHNSDGVKA